METYAFEDLVGDREVFFSEYFNQKPLLRRGAFTNHLKNLVSVSQLDDIIALEAVKPSYVRVAKDGKGVPHKAYTRTVTTPGAALADTLVPDNLYELFRAGGTITWNSVNHFLPPARRLLEVFTRTLGCRGEVVAFLTPAGRDGYAPHHDPVDVYVVQVEGTKSWRVWDTPSHRRGDKATYGGDELGEPAMEITLHAGDVLYLPYNTPHAAAAKDEVSLHLSVTVELRRWRDLLRETVDTIVEDEAFHDFPYLDDGQDQTAITALAGKLSLLQERLAHVDPHREAKRLASAGRRTPAREFSRLTAADVVSPDTALRRSLIPITLTDSDGTKTALVTNGHRLAVPDGVAAVLRDLESGGSVTAAGVFPDVAEPRSLRAAQGLIRLGVLEAADQTRS